MVRIGKPLCAIYYIEGENKKCVPFQYKSQSVLNAMGYTVEAERDLSVDVRQKILREALDKKLFEIHDVLSYLNWLIKTRHRGNNEIRQIFEGIASDKETHSGK